MPNVAIPTLKRTIENAARNNDVTVPSTDQVTLRDGAVSTFTPLRFVMTADDIPNQRQTPALRIEGNDRLGSHIALEGEGDRLTLGPNNCLFEPTANFCFFGARSRGSTNPGDGTTLILSSGGSFGAGNTGGDVRVRAGFGSGGGTNGAVLLADVGSRCDIGGASTPVNILGELQIAGATTIKFLVVSGNPNGSVTAPIGSLAVDSTNAALYQNTDGLTTWTLR